MTEHRLPPIHPGEILLEEFLKPMNISQYRLAKDMSVPARRINEIVQGKRAISADTALRLSRYFGLSERFWMNLQARYDLETEKDRLAGRLEHEVRAYAAGNATACCVDIVTAGPLWSFHSGAWHSDQGNADEAGGLAEPSRCPAIQRRNQPNKGVLRNSSGCSATGEASASV